MPFKGKYFSCFTWLIQNWRKRKYIYNELENNERECQELKKICVSLTKSIKGLVDKCIPPPLKELILKSIPRPGTKYLGKIVLSGLWIYLSLKYLDVYLKYLGIYGFL